LAPDNCRWFANCRRGRRRSRHRRCRRGVITAKVHPEDAFVSGRYRWPVRSWGRYSPRWDRGIYHPCGDGLEDGEIAGRHSGGGAFRSEAVAGGVEAKIKAGGLGDDIDGLLGSLDGSPLEGGMEAGEYGLEGPNRNGHFGVRGLWSHTE